MNNITPKQAATAAKSLQSCPTLCDPVDSSPPGFPVPGILQARTLKWVPNKLGALTGNLGLQIPKPTSAAAESVKELCWKPRHK